MNASDTLQLNCPKCNAPIRASAKSVGKRVRCPRCQAAFKIPGQAAVEKDDDDWLNLESLEKEKPSEPSVSTRADASAPLRGSASASPLAGPGSPAMPAGGTSHVAPPDDDDDELDSFMLKSEELPRPTDPKKEPPTKTRSGAGFSDADMKALNSILKEPHRKEPHSRERHRTRSGSSEADQSRIDELVEDVLGEPDAVTEFRVTCPICSSLTYARTDQVGKQIKCSDCYSVMTIPPPPKAKKQYTPDIENAETFAMVDSGEPAPIYGGPMARSAAELLRDAEENSDGDEESRDNYDNPDVKKWLSDIFRIFGDPGVLLHLLILSLLGSLPGVASVLIGHAGFALVSMMLTVLYFAFVLACAFSILESVANGEKEVSEWPYMQPGEWLGRMLMAVAAACLAGGPAAFLGNMIFGFSLGTVAMTMFSLYIFFPFVLLSMLDSESILVPFSPEVSKSVARCQEAWGVLYLSAGLLFFGLLIFYVVISLMPPLLTAVLASFGTVGALFTYFSMIGRLAYAIGHSVNAPPLKNDIDRIRAKERAERQVE